MSEYMEKHSVSRMIGAPPGYVGYDEGGALTESIRRRPYQVILFEDVEKAQPSVMNVVRQHFRPEFMNRIDEIILFKRLGRAEMDGIVRIQLQRVEKLLADRRMSIALDASALHWLADRGYDPVYGARPLKRVIQKELIDPIAKQLLAGDLEDGAVIDVTASADGLE